MEQQKTIIEQTAQNDADFSQRHAEELSVKRFAVTKTMETLIPLGSASIGGFIGYKTLGPTVTRIFPKIVDTAKLSGAAALGTVGMIIGGTFVGFHEWRKQESTRLAAAEIDRDISKLELFHPSDPELVAENKRLRGMLAEAEKPAHTISNVSHHGHAKDAAEHQLG